MANGLDASCDAMTLKLPAMKRLLRRFLLAMESNGSEIADVELHLRKPDRQRGEYAHAPSTPMAHRNSPDVVAAGWEFAFCFPCRQRSTLADPKLGPHVHFEAIGPDGHTIVENSHVLIPH